MTGAADAELADVDERARRFGAMVQLRGGLRALTDDELTAFLGEQRWAIGQLASPRLPPATRSRLNAAVLRSHALLHHGARRPAASTGDALRRVAPMLVPSAAVFLGAAGLAYLAVAREPVLAYAFVPREFLAQLGDDAWGSRGGAGADFGMTFFYWSNNLRATFLALGLGALGGVLGMAAVGVNGALLGAVAAAAVARGIGDNLLSWILPHGVPELGALILAGAIGLELGRALLVPGWRTRAASMAEAGRATLPMIFTAALLVLAAAPLEGFVAPRAMPWAVKALFPLAWVAFLGFGAHRVLRARPASDRVSDPRAGRGDGGGGRRRPPATGAPEATPRPRR